MQNQMLFFKKKLYIKQESDFIYKDQQLRDIQNCLSQKENELLLKIINTFNSIKHYQYKDIYTYIK